MFASPSARRRLGLAAVAALACASAAVPSGASAKARAAQAAQGSVSSKPGVSAAALAAGRARYGADVTPHQAVAAYWTPARMKAATPIEEAPFLAAANQRYEAISADRRKRAATAGKRGIRPPKRGPALTVAPKTQSEVASKPAASAAAFNPNLNYWQPTAYTNGKVFFMMGGGSFQCSAAIVNSEGRDTVWTAGHCVHGGSGGQWATNWQFVPAYDDDLANPAPYGTWTAAQLWSRTAWTNNSDFAEDMGVAVMNTRLGWHIVDYFGGHGFRANIGKNVFENAMGYPAEAPFDGGNLLRCWGTSSPEWQVLFWSSETIKIPCDLTRGSSGGPWLNGYDGNWGYLNGLNSRIDRIAGPTIMLSPYFDNTALSLYNDTRWQ